MDIYDTATNTWTTANLSEGRRLLTATSAAGKVFFAGGTSSSGFSSVVDIYDVATDTWSTANLSQARRYLSATSVGSKAFFGGGFLGLSSNVVDIYTTPIQITQQPTPASLSVCAGSSATSSLSATGAGTLSYQWYRNQPNTGEPVAGQTTATLSLSNVQSGDAGSYFALVTGDGNSVWIDAFTLTVNALPTVSISPNSSMLTCATSSVSLTANGGVSYLWENGSSEAVRSISSEGTYSVSVTNGSGCTATAITTVQSNTTLAAPTLATQTGHPYPGGVNNITVPQYSPAVVLVGANCAGTINWTGPNNTAGTSTITVSTTQTGQFVYQSTCQVGNCISPPASATVTVGPPVLQVLHHDNDRNLTNNVIHPYLQLQNSGASPIPYGEITVRYWLTAEQFAPMTNLSVYWAQLGTDKVKMTYVELPQPRQGALGYIEYRFEGSAGNLAPGANSGPIQNGVAKSDWTPFNEADDYAYANNANYMINTRITAYRNGTLIWGIEPSGVAPQRQLKILTQNKSAATTHSISTFLQLNNEGNVAVNYSDVKVRYYFTSEGSQPLNFYLDFAVLGNNNVKGTFVKVNPPLDNADTYLEFSFPNLGKLYPLSGTGNIQYRIAMSDWSNFSQSNDHSYQSVSNAFVENNRVVIYVAGQRVYGTEPGAGAREGYSEISPDLAVQVLGNPVAGQTLELEISGVEGQRVGLELVDLNRHRLGGQQVERAGEMERVKLGVATLPGVFLLQVSTDTQRQVIRVVKP
ncbi:hypothetical protein IC229_00740 [Spirosoma sp. BT702]|uniref:Ig-like domain-containing protein n=1 Tax=Spirosoma profusum TaxID=2771354 RepID=A0A927APW1_9BACT|nr:hypothetical protein [Spirosoma profusum]